MTIKLFSLIKELLGRDIDINKFNDRLILQKLTYILKNAGLDFGYRFNWHIRGPYSISLSSDAFEFYQNPDRRCVEISDKDKRYLREIRNFLSQDINNAEKLELIASLLFLKNEENLSFSDPRLVSQLHSLKPWFTERQIKSALNKISSSGLFN